ncbi:MAG: glycosyltransferase [Acidimicrobiales bacterium]
MRTVSVVVPAYEEADVIATSLQRLRAELPGALGSSGVELVVVDDGSRDETAAVARKWADVVVESPRNRGKGHAVRTGMAVATGDVVAFCDADLAYPPSVIAAVLAPVLDGADAALGDRRLAPGAAAPSRLRRIGGWAISVVAGRFLVGRRLDTQCGLKAFTATTARDVFGRCRVDGFAFDVEVIHLLDRRGHSFVQVPVSVDNRVSSSVRPLRDGVSLLRDIARIRTRSRRGDYGPRVVPGSSPARGSVAS